MPASNFAELAEPPEGLEIDHLKEVLRRVVDTDVVPQLIIAEKSLLSVREAMTPPKLHVPKLAWVDDSRVELDRLVEAEPVMLRISAAKRLRDAAESHARSNGKELVAPDHVAAAAGRLVNAA
jgi:hypothetical protein